MAVLRGRKEFWAGVSNLIHSQINFVLVPIYWSFILKISGLQLGPFRTRTIVRWGLLVLHHLSFITPLFFNHRALKCLLELIEHFVLIFLEKNDKPSSYPILQFFFLYHICPVVSTLLPSTYHQLLRACKKSFVHMNSAICKFGSLNSMRGIFTDPIWFLVMLLLILSMPLVFVKSKWSPFLFLGYACSVFLPFCALSAGKQKIQVYSGGFEV